MCQMEQQRHNKIILTVLQDRYDILFVVFLISNWEIQFYLDTSK